MHWKVPLLRVPDVGATAVHDCVCCTKSMGGTNVVMLKVHVAVLTPAVASLTTIVHWTIFELDPVLIDVGVNEKLDIEGATMSSGLDVTVSVDAGMNGELGEFPTASIAKTDGVQVPASAKRGIVSVHDQVPLFVVPDDGALDPHATVCELSGAATWQAAVATPDFASVSVMLHVTLCEDDETLTLDGTRLKFVKDGATVSGSDVTVSVEGKPDVPGSSCAVLPTASVADPLAVHVPDGAYRGTVIVHDQTPFCGVPDDGVLALQLARWRRSGDVKAHVALTTPDSASVSVMLHVTVCDDSVVLIEFGLKLNAVSTGAEVSHCARAGSHDARTTSDAIRTSARGAMRFDMAMASVRSMARSIR